MKLAAVILNYNDAKRVCALALKLSSYAIFEKIVVSDNNSKDVDELECLNLTANIVVLRNKDNRGYAAGNNYGLRFLKNYGIDYVLTINSDMDVSKKSILDLADFLSKHDEIAAASILQKDRKKNGKLKIARNFYDIPTFFQTLNYFNAFKKSCHIVQHDGYFTCGYVRESCALYNYRYFEKIGFYDEIFFMFDEGPSSSNALAKLGYKEAILQNGDYCIHNHIGSYMSRRQFTWLKQSRTKYLRKYCGCNSFQVFLFNLIWLNVFIK